MPDRNSILDVLPQEGSSGTSAPTRTTLSRELAPAQVQGLDTLAQKVGGRRELILLATWALSLAKLQAARVISLGVNGRTLDIEVPPTVAVGSWIAALPTLLTSAPATAAGATPDTVWSDQLTQPPAGDALGAGQTGPGALGISFASPHTGAGVGLLLDVWLQVLADVGAKWNAPITELSVLSASDRAQLLKGADPARWTYTGTLSVGARFSEIARAYADRPALLWRGGSLSYAQLERTSDLLANQLVEAGVAAGEVVALALGRSPQAIIGMLGILKAGAAYLPVDLKYPPERLQFMLDDAGVRCVLAPEGATLPSRVRVLHVPGVPAAATSPVNRPIAGEALAYVMYTSGSTGTPKGVEIPHRAILRLVAQANFMRLDDSVTMLHAAPPGFDASTLEIWGPLLNGGRCVLHDEDVPTGPGLARTIAEFKVTSAWLTAALFNSVVDDDPRHLSGLVELLAGGEALSPSHCRRVLEALPGLSLINGYGPTECTTFAATHRLDRAVDLTGRSIPIGRPITETQLYICNGDRELMPRGLVGELLIGGLGVGRGYLNRSELTAERFIRSPFATDGSRLYRTGDLVRYRDDGAIEFIGRVDNQVKIRGFRIEPGEIEAVIATHSSVRNCAVIPWSDPERGVQLVAYVVATEQDYSAATLRKLVASRLPEFMVPAAFVRLDALPVTQNGKLDRRALPKPARQRPEELPNPFIAAASDIERAVAEIIANVLGIDRVGQLDNFFELGGNSLLILRVLSGVRSRGLGTLAPATLFADPTARGIARALSGTATEVDARRITAARAKQGDEEPIAIIGMAGRFPGADDIEAFWRVLCEGRDTIRMFRADEIDAAVPASLRSDPSYVLARGVLNGVADFDAAFFGISAKEAELMDPQQRLFLEACWECLERAGHVPEKYPAPIGVFAGMYNASYFQRHVLAHPDKVERVGEFQVMLANEKDYIATRTANRLNLTGPAVSVHTACSTSLVAVSMAFDSLRSGQCGMALAGGSSITCPPSSGYLYQEGAMLSPDGHTRTFDTNAQGTVFSDGVAVVLLKRLSDAIADGNTIYAVIRGTAVNNDGGEKASFTAPSVEGQAAVVAAALARAQVDARSISYIEAHGTATPLGDPVEIAGLTKAYRRDTQDNGYCLIGSLKSNMGHMVIAAGASGVIKTALALANEHLPASIHYTAPNPKIAFETTPFKVVDRATSWPRGKTPRRAGVSSFGVGGTNAHAILEEAPIVAASEPARGPQLLKLSARSKPALEAALRALGDHLERNPAMNLADVAWTLDTGRREFVHRAWVVAEDAASAAKALRDPQVLRASRQVGTPPTEAVFLFSGQGAQYAGMGSGLYDNVPAFRQAFDECIAAFKGEIDFELKALMFGNDAAALSRTENLQPALFVLEYSLAQAWIANGVRPTALIGHSIGEYAAAAVSGVMSLKDAATLVANRGRLMQQQPAGSMLSVRLDSATLEPMIPAGLQLCVENSPTACVVGGPEAAVNAFAAELAKKDIVTRVLVTSHAFHSEMMDAAVPPFEAVVRKVKLNAPRIPIISTRTGKLLTPEEAVNPAYWSGQIRATVRFSTAAKTALQVAGRYFIEMGPRGTLVTLVRQHAPAAAALVAAPSLADSPEREWSSLADAAGQLWAGGVPTSWNTGSRRGMRVVLPTYPFERKRYWVDAPASTGARAAPVTITVNPSQPSAGAALPSPANLIPLTHNIPDQPMALATQSTSAPSASRLPALIARLREVFEDTSGVEMGEVDSSAGFVEVGLDSLTLTQVALQLKKNFGVAVTFRHLMENYSSLDALAAFLDEQLPADQFASAAPAAAPVAVAAPQAVAPQVPTMTTTPVPSPMMQFAMPAQVAGANPLLQSVIQQQMQLMATQLALLAGAGGAFAMPVAAAPMQPVAAPFAPSPAPGAASAFAPAAASPAAAPVAAASAPAAASAAAAKPAAASGIVAAAAGGIDDENPASHSKYDVKKAFGAIARIHTTGSQMTERQRARLEAFMTRYIERTKKSKAYTTEHRPHLADPRVVNGFRPQLKEIIYQIVIERSKGSHMWDLDGNEYVDALNGFGMSLFGWQPDFVLDAVRKQLDSGYDIGPQHPLAGEVAKLFCEVTGNDRAGLCNTGSEAVMGCVRIARTVTGRSKIAIFTGAYHGIFDEVIVRGTKKLKSVPAAPGIMPNTSENVVCLDYGTPETLKWLQDNAHDLAAILVEPVQSRRPDFQPVEFLRQLRELTTKSGTLLIFDEVVTGFRSHPGGIQALFNIKADLASYGKVVGGGFPIGVIAGKREYMDALDGGHWQFGDDSIPTVGVTYFAGTFVRHPLALVAAKAVLEHVKKHGPSLQKDLNDRTTAMVEELNAFCKESGVPIVLKSFSSVWKTFFLEDHPLQDLLFAMMRSRGIHILDNFPCFFTTAHTAEDFAAIKRAFKESVAELVASDFIPGRVVATVQKPFDASRPPVAGARLGRDADGKPGWFVANPAAPGKYMKVEA